MQNGLRRPASGALNLETETTLVLLGSLLFPTPTLSIFRGFLASGISPDAIRFECATWRFRQPGPPSGLLDTFRRFYGPTMNAFEAAAKDGREDRLLAELDALFAAQNSAGEGTDIPATFLKVTVVKA